MKFGLSIHMNILFGQLHLILMIRIFFTLVVMINTLINMIFELQIVLYIQIKSNILINFMNRIHSMGITYIFQEEDFVITGSFD